MDWLKKHADSVAVIGAVAIAVWLMKGDISAVEGRINEKIANLDKRLTVIETVMIMQGNNIKGIAANKIEEDK